MALPTGAGPPLPPFEPDWDFHASTIVGVAVLAALYLWAVGPWRRRAAPGEPVPAWRIASFLSGLAVMLLALNGPLHDLSDSYLFSAHMVQHLLIAQVVPPLLLLGVPAYAWRAILRPRWTAALARVLGRPPVAFALFAITFSAWHLQGAYALMMRNHDVHIAAHLMFMATAVIFWWPVLNPLPAFPRLSPGPAMVYLFLAGLPMMIVGALITLSGTILYPWYASAPRVAGLSPLVDQQLGGLIMWVPGGMYDWIAMSVIFFRWTARERRGEDEEYVIGAPAARRPTPGTTQRTG